MKKPVFRHPNKFQVLPWREYIRENIPSGIQGFVYEDLDLVARRFSKEDPIGKFMFIEIKYKDTMLGVAQTRTFGLIDRLLRSADPERKRYVGYYLMQYPDPDPNKCDHIRVNEQQLTMEEFKKWLRFELDIQPYKFGYKFGVDFE